jgi:hypothetical protein
MNATRLDGGNTEYAIVSFTTSNGIRKGIKTLNGLTVTTNLETKTLRARRATKTLILTLAGPFPRHNDIDYIKKAIKKLSGY